MSLTRTKNRMVAACRAWRRAQLVALRASAPLTSDGTKMGQGLLQRLRNAPVVDDEPVGLAIVGAVHAGDGLQERVCSRRGRRGSMTLLDGRVEAGQEHVAQRRGSGKRVVLHEEPPDEILALVLARVVPDEPILVLVGSRDDDGRLRGVQPVERLLVEGSDLPAARDNLRLELVRPDVSCEVVDEIEADRLDSLGGPCDRPLGRVLLLDGLSLLLGAVGLNTRSKTASRSCR